MKVLHILNTNKFSGAENVVCQIINMFKDNSQISMSYCSPKGSIEKILAQKGIEYVPIKKVNISEIERVIHEKNPDIIHAHDIRAGVITSLCHKKVKIICTIHGNDIRMRKLCGKSLSSLLILKESSHIFWVSRSCLEQYVFKRLAMNKSSILPNVIDKNELLKKIKEDNNNYTFDVVFLGRIAEPKNPERLMNVLEIACRINKNLQVAIVGDGPLLSELLRKIKENRLENNIKCMGFMENPVKLLSQAKILVMTSDWEGTPMCVLEAMALGVPIVSTPTDGIVDLIKNDVSGFLSWDNDLLAEKINEFVSDTSLWEKLSKNILKKFDEVNNIENYKSQLMKYYKR